MEGIGFWSRVGSWFKGGASEGDERPPYVVGRDGPDPQIIPSKRGGEATGDGFRRRGLRGDGRLDRLAEDRERLVSLMESVRDHLEAQASRSERLTASIERLADGLAGLPESMREQSGLLKTINESLAAESAATKRIEESLSQVPRIADAQRETMVSIGRQLDAARQTSERAGGAVDEVRKAMTDLGEATTASTRTQKEIWSQAAVRDERLGALMAEQTRRLTLFAWGAIGLAAVAALAGVLALML